jgi:hypothetical protein
MASGSPLHQPVMFREGLLATLRPFLAHYVPGQPGAAPLVMRLTGLEVAERLDRFSEAALAGLTADFYAPQPDSSYRLVAHIGQVRERSAIGLIGDATGLHAANIGELLLAAVVQARDVAHWPNTGPSYPAAYVLATEPHPAEFLPVLEPTIAPRPGYYHSLTDFWNNQPTEPGVPTVETHPYQGSEWAGEQEVKPYRLNAAGKLALATDVWGFCDGRYYYVRRERDFYRLRRQGQDLTFYGRIGQDKQYRVTTAGRSATSLVSGGLVGSILARGIAETDGDRSLFTLSLLTGNVSLDQPSQSMSETAARPTHLFVYRPRNAKGAAVRIRLANSETTQELAAGEFLTFEPASDQPVQVYLVSTTGPEVSLTVIPTADAPLYLECRPTAAAPLRQMPDNEGAAALTRLVK